MNAHEPHVRPVLFTDDGNTARCPPESSVLMSQAMTEIGFGDLSGPSRLDVAQHRRKLLRMDPVEPLLRRVSNFVLFAAHEGDPPGREVNPVRSQIPFPERLAVSAGA